MKDKDIRIVTAFATNTEDLVCDLLRANRSVELIVGTINAFTSPDFIRNLANEAELDFHVDFRDAKSVHWKLALVSPATVVIGSANLTEMGLRLERDICVTLWNPELYNEYARLIDNLVKQRGVVSAHAREFARLLAAYQVKHDRMQAGRHFGSATAGKLPSLEEWLANEANDGVKMFIWKDLHGEEGKKLASKIVRRYASARPEVLKKYPDSFGYRDFFTLDEAGVLPSFNAGDIVICANQNGSHMDFYTFDIVYRDEGNGRRRDFMIALRQARYRRLFDLTPIAAKLATLIKSRGIKGKYVLGRRELAKIV